MNDHSPLLLLCATVVTCAALGLLVHAQRRARERAMLLTATEPASRRTGGVMFVSLALLCTVPVFLFLPNPTSWMVGGLNAAAPREQQSQAPPPEIPRGATDVVERTATDLPSQQEAPVETDPPARPEEGAYGERFSVDEVVRDKGRANTIVLYVKSSRPVNLRGQLYDRFENNRWHGEAQPFEDLSLEQDTLELVTPSLGPDRIRQTVDVVRNLDTTLVHAPGVRRLRFPGESVRRYADEVFVAPQALRAQTTYSVESQLTLAEQRYALAGRGAAAFATYRDTTALTERQRDLARRVTAGLSGARAKRCRRG